MIYNYYKHKLLLIYIFELSYNIDYLYKYYVLQ